MCGLLILHADSLFGDREEFLWGARSPRLKSRAAGVFIYQKSKKTFDKSILAGTYIASPLSELETILSASSADLSPTRWYVVPSKFIHEWLSYVEAKKEDVAVTAVGQSEKEEEEGGGGPPPGPRRPEKLDNSSQLEVDRSTKLWKVKSGIRRASNTDGGDYRLVNRQTFQAYCELYAGSGPIIFVEDNQKNNLGEWFIDQSAVIGQGGALFFDEPAMRKNSSSALEDLLGSTADAGNLFDDFLKFCSDFVDSVKEMIEALTPGAEQQEESEKYDSMEHEVVEEKS